MLPVGVQIILSIALFLILIGVPSAGLIYVGKQGKLRAEQLLLTIIGASIAIAIAFNWGTYGNVHGGAVLLALIMLISAPVILAEFALLSMFRTKTRLVQSLITLIFPIVSIFLATTFGR